MPETISAGELAHRVNAWCEEHGVTPANGQAGEAVTERSVRYYRTVGLLDVPDGGFGEKHVLQLVAVRILQAQGLPLRRIRELLHGRSVADLREIQRRGAEEIRNSTAATMALSGGGTDGLWRMMPIDEDFLIVSRHGTVLSDEQRAAVAAALRGAEFPNPRNQNE